ncbi:MAG: hypothetical protein J7L62_00815 [Candidatus Aminicenantes bacterium]|nr:hypothetical protein [Candidatus Aminicenantes bacterium]
MDWKERLNGLANNRVLGSTAILRDSYDAVLEALEKGEELEEVALHVARLLHSHPTMAVLINFFHRFFNALENDKEVRMLWKELDRETEENAKLASSLIPNKGKVVLYSHSLSLLKALEENKKNITVILSESRPYYEGRIMAEKLVEMGYKVEFTYDAFLPVMVEKSEIVLIGSDAITSQGVINRAGSFSLALAAKQFKKPFFVIGHTSKVLYGHLSSYFSVYRENGEVLNAPSGSKPVGNVFDLTPWKVVSAVIINSMIVSPKDIPFKQTKTSSLLHRAYQAVKDELKK